eukprot:TRINITY_DN45202_c0_g1_i3.p1 TRINITY_DN45202_c0_g1~~TRINITY_DN45202_c0_g1_i3.p1  ORF type:complete len:377 (+),score=13.81 TRINITY_DN45202_c0_g1_i3:37-1131(+)
MFRKAGQTSIFYCKVIFIVMCCTTVVIYLLSYYNQLYSSQQKSQQKWRKISTNIYKTSFTYNPQIKYVWSYWEQGEINMCNFMSLNIQTWKAQLQDGWEINVLNYNPQSPRFFLKYLSLKDLPRSFQKLNPTERSDCLRLALLAKYGGVWMDPSIVLLRPINQFVQYENSQPVHMFEFYMSYYGVKKFDKKDFYENWFIAANKESPLLQKWNEYYQQFQNTRKIGQKSWQHEMFKHLDLSNFIKGGNDFRSYLLQHIAFRKVIEDNQQLYQYWNEYVTKVDAMKTAYIITKLLDNWDADIIKRKFFDKQQNIEQNQFFEKIMQSPLLKFNNRMYKKIKGLSEKQLLDPNSTMGQVYNYILQKNH